MVGTWCLSEVILLEGILPDWRGHGLCNQLMERQCSTTWSLASEATLLLLLSRFSHVRLYATPWTAAHQAPPSLGFSRTLEWVAISFSNCMKVKSESEVAQSCPTLSDPMDRSPPGSSIHGIFQARVLEWSAIAFSRRLHYMDSNHTLCVTSGRLPSSLS